MRDHEEVDRTDRRLKLAIRLVILPGLIAASYLTWAKLTDSTIACGVGHGCGAVNQSEWSEVLGMPVTLLGMIAYVVLFISTFLPDELGKILGAFVAVTGAAFSVFLQYEALVVLELTCPWCLTSAIAMLILAALTLTRLLRIPGGDDPTASDDVAGDSAATA